MVEGGLRLMTRIWRGRAGKAKSSSGWMISATSSPCQPFPLLDCTICSSGTSKTGSGVFSWKGVCSTPCLLSCGQEDAADTDVIPSFSRFYHKTVVNHEIKLAHLQHRLLLEDSATVRFLLADSERACNWPRPRVTAPASILPSLLTRGVRQRSPACATG